MLNNKRIIWGILIASIIVNVALILRLVTDTDISQIQTEEADTYAMNVVVSNVPFWQDTRTMWQELQGRSGAVTRFGGPASTDAQAQIDEIEAISNNDLDGLVLAPTDSEGLREIVNDLAEQNIPVVTYLVDVIGSDRLIYITSTLEEAGDSIATYAISKYDQPAGKAIISIGTAGSEEQERRADGLRQAISRYESIEIVETVVDEFDMQVGSEQIKAVLAENPDIQYIFGTNSRSAAGAKLALEEMGYAPGEVIVTGWDQDEDVITAIEDGWVQATVKQRTKFMTFLAFSILDAIEDGYLTWQKGKNGTISDLPDIVEVPVTIISRENTSEIE